MKREDINAAMSGQSLTNGWDAVCALDQGLLGQFFLQNYLQDGPTSPSQPLQLLVNVEGSIYMLVDLLLGPPDVSFPSGLGNQQAQLSMFVIRGNVITFDAGQQVIQNVVPQQSDQTLLSGVLNLANVTGEAGQIGQLVLDLGSNAWTPQLLGVASSSVANTNLGAALQTFFKSNSVVYPLGTVATSGVPASLQPSSFQFVTATDGNGNACVQLLIQTNGTAGPVEALPTYPIPDGSTAALILSNQTLFSGALPALLEQGPLGTSMGASAAGQQSGGLWQTAIQNGSVNIGVLGKVGDYVGYYTSVTVDSIAVVPPAGADVVMPLSGTFSAVGGNLNFSWSGTWTQVWAYAVHGVAEREKALAIGWCSTDVSMGVTFNWNGQPGLTSGSTNLISFTDASNPVPLPSGSGSRWDDFWDSSYISLFQSQSQAQLQSTFGGFQVSDLSTFSLQNLLFPSKSGFQMVFDSVSLPGDLYITGQVPPTLVVTAEGQTSGTTPSFIPLAPGATQQLTATLSGSTATVTWGGNLSGSVSATGLYTAPASVDGVVADVVLAIDSSSTSTVGGVLILVSNPPAAAALTLTPPSITLTAGQSANFTVTDSQGNPVDGPVPVLSAGGTGTVQATPLGGTGAWTYQAPSTLSVATSLTLTATSSSDASATGSATLTLLPGEAVTISPSATMLTAGQQVQLSASSDTLEYFNWMLWPPGVGTLSTSSSGATYTAPATIPSNPSVTVIAYSVGLDAMGIGLTTLTLSADAQR